eukprot:219897_1
MSQQLLQPTDEGRNNGVIDPEVCRFLQTNQLAELKNKFEGLKLEHLREIDAKDLDEFCQSLHLNIKQKIQLKHAIKKLKQTQPQIQKHDSKPKHKTQLSNKQKQIQAIEQKRNDFIESQMPESAKGKVVVLGFTNVGKSSIVEVISGKNFDPLHGSTIGAAFLALTQSVTDKFTAKFDVWDTAGQESQDRYSSIRSMYYRGAYAIIIVYDISWRESYERAKQLVAEVQYQAIGYDKILLIGNKTDLNDKREVPTGEALKYATTNTLAYIETSAKTKDNLDTVMEWLGKLLQNKVINQGVLKDDEIIKLDEHLLKLDKEIRRPNQKKCC